jgi:hypothetical protein
MKSEPNAIVAAMLVVVLLGGSLVSCFWSEDTPEEEFSVTGKVTGLSSYNQPKLDVKADEITDRGIPLGSLFKIETEKQTFENAVLLDKYLGIFMFDIFVNIESDGYLSIGCVGKLISADVDSEITLTHTGMSQRYGKTPHYNAGSTDNRADYSSDEVFANFYEVTGGDLTTSKLYRSFSSLYAPSKQTRSTYVNQLAEEAGIQYLIALSYSDAAVKKAVDELEGYCITLCAEGKYVAPSMGYLYIQQKEKTAEVLRGIMDNDGPYLVHCNVGRDRTGFVILLLQALCNCTPDEMKECEARAFCNLYHIDPNTTEYKTLVNCTYDRNMYLIANPDQADNIFEIDWEHIDASSINTYSAAYSFCTDYLGFTDEEVSCIKERLCS